MNARQSPDRDHEVLHIIGQGLAGSVLAILLIEKGYKVHVHDDGYRSASSTVAAGMWNPLSFVNLKLARLANEMLAVMEEIYPRLETLLQAEFYHPMPLVRIFPDAGSANIWDERMISPSLRQFIAEASEFELSERLRAPFGYGVVNHCGWLDLPVFLKAAKDFITKHATYTLHEVKTDEWHALLANGDWVMLCTGWKKPADDFGADLPLMANKGQVFTLQVDGLHSDCMIKFSRFIIPLGNNLFRVGSTYEHNPKDAEPSAAADEILVDFAELTEMSFKVIEHKAGYRPTTHDRLPLIGLHDRHHKLGIFTGFGSRGVIAAPMYAVNFIEHLVAGRPLYPESDWHRFAGRRK